MKWMAPSYYPAFVCVGGECPHNCCIGWEIDIDAESLTRYEAVTGSLGEKLRQNIDHGGCPHFVLGEGERCPFLNRDNLCELILTLGEGSLCQICRDHPRFYNEWPSRTEAGLGLCCPTAAELILTWAEPVTMVEIGADDEEPWDEDRELLALRERLMHCLRERTQPISERLVQMCAVVGTAPDQRAAEEWEAVYRPLERMDAAWDAVLDRLQEGDTRYDAPTPAMELAQEQLAAYLLYRHLFGAWEDGEVVSRVAFAAHVVTLLSGLAHDVREFIEVARLYSAEIEYSEENLTAVLERLTKR